MEHKIFPWVFIKLGGMRRECGRINFLHGLAAVTVAVATAAAADVAAAALVAAQ